MFSKYFLDFSKQLTKKPASKKTATTKKTGTKKTTSVKVDMKKIKESISKIIPSELSVDGVNVIDKTGFSPDGTDFVVYKEYCPDILKIMGGYIPYELARGIFFVVPTLDKKSLIEVLTKVVAAKKLNRFSLEDDEKEEDDAEFVHIPVFILALNSKYDLLDLKNDIVNWYLAKGIDLSYEFDLMSVVNTGVVMKNWREKNYLAIESMEDTSMWFFMLMNEYLENENILQFEFRDYIKKETVYNQY